MWTNKSCTDNSKARRNLKNSVGHKEENKVQMFICIFGIGKYGKMINKRLPGTKYYIIRVKTCGLELHGQVIKRAISVFMFNKFIHIFFKVGITYSMYIINI